MRGAVGSSVNFTWGFSGNFLYANWGLKKTGASDLETNGVLVQIDKNGQVALSGPSAYTGRVSGSFSPGQAVYTLSSITKADERVYGCRLDPTGFDRTQFDYLHLQVEGG